jgi:hypothetical protein
VLKETAAAFYMRHGMEDAPPQGPSPKMVAQLLEAGAVLGIFDKHPGKLYSISQLSDDHHDSKHTPYPNENCFECAVVHNLIEAWLEANQKGTHGEV